MTELSSPCLSRSGEKLLDVLRPRRTQEDWFPGHRQFQQSHTVRALPDAGASVRQAARLVKTPG